MTNIVQFAPRPRKSYKRLKHSDVERQTVNRIRIHEQLKRECSWWGRLRSNIARLFGSCSASPSTSGQSSANSETGSAA